ncbi:MAG: molybdopterin molybdotransferase MoeA [Bacteroidales bacterium]|nr:molybdopterin molybdotransferase MoeA [Bacteroidales bacterium]
MITFEQALQVVLDAVGKKADLPKERCEYVSLEDSCGRVLQQVVKTDRDTPPFHKSAMDGYACTYADLEQGRPMRLLEVVPAGTTPKYQITGGCCSKVMTGAMVPQGAEYVLMVEDAIVEDNTVCTAPHCRIAPHKTNICLRGEDVQAGVPLLNLGAFLKPQHIAMLAAYGYTELCVAIKPKVGIISTGDELVEPSVTPSDVQIRNSNGWQLLAQVSRAGASPSYYGIVQDKAQALRAALMQALKENAVVVLSGGVSMGDFDMVPEVLKSLGVNILFDRVAVQPGKPTLFGVWNNGGDSRYLFGLPGNPVSSFIQFELMVRPLLMSLMGAFPQAITLRLPLSHPYRRKSAERMAHLPMEIDESGRCNLLNYNGSGHITALNTAHGMARIPLGVLELQEDAAVEVILL